MITMIPPKYLVEITSMKPPTISVDATVASRHAADTQQEPPTLHTPQQRAADAKMGGNTKEEEAVEGEEIGN